MGAKINVRRWLCWWAVLAATAVSAGPKYATLTIDDGPNPAFLSRALDLFDQHGVKVTFFNVGQMVKAYGAWTDECIKRGHEVENHSWSHPQLSRSSQAKIRSELATTSALLKTHLGHNPRFLRPPYGATNGTVKAIAGSMGMQIAMWTVDPQDWRTNATADGDITKILKQLHNNAVILIHEKPTTLRALPGILAGIEKRGYRLVKYSELMRLKATADQPAERTVVVNCGAGDNDQAQVAKGFGYALERGLRAASPAAWVGRESLRFKLLVPRGVTGTLRMQLLADGDTSVDQQQVTVGDHDLGKFQEGSLITAPITAADTAQGMVIVTVTAVGASGPRVSLVTVDAAPAH